MKQLWANFLKRRDEAAFVPLYQEAHRLVYTLCARLLGDEEHAADAAQATWTQLLTQLRGGARLHAEEPRAYLSTLAVREADALRKRLGRRSAKEILVAEAPESIDPEAQDTRSQLAQAELRAQLLELVHQLPEQERVPVLLHYFDGLTQQEIAEALGIPIGTIGVQIGRGRKRLEPLCRRAGISSAAGALTAVAGSAALMVPTASASAASVFAIGGGGLPVPVAAGSFVITKGAVATVGGALIGLMLVLGVTYVGRKSPAVTGMRMDQAASRSTVSKAEESRQPVDASRPKQPADASDPERQSSTEAPRVALGRGDTITLDLRWADTNQPVHDATVTRLDGEGRPFGKKRHALRSGSLLTISSDARAPFIGVTHEEADGGMQRFAMPARGKLEGRLQRATIVFGTVLLADGTPARDAKVTYARPNDRVTTATLADGSYKLFASGPGDGSLFASTAQQNSVGDDRQDWVEVKAHRRNGPFDLRLKEGRLLSVLVLDAETKAPVKGAEVLTQQGELATTDESGVASFPAQPPREWQVQVRAAGYALKRSTMNLQTAEDSILEVQINRGGRIFGRVTDEEGKPLAEVAIRDLYSGPILFGRKTRTDAEGRYSMEDWFLGEEIFGIEYAKPGYASLMLSQITVPASTRELEQDVTLVRGVGLTGEVVNSTGIGIAGAKVEFGGQNTVYFREAQTDAAGHFSLENISPKTFWPQVVVTAKGFSPAVRDVKIGVEASVRIVMEPPNFIHGRVIDSAGRPIAGVYVAPTLSRQMHHYLGNVRTGSDGRFDFDALGPASIFDIYGLDYSALRRHPLPLNQPEIVDVVLPSEGIIFGRVVHGEADEPVTRFNIRLEGVIPEAEGELLSGIEVSRSERGQEFDPPDGSFTLGDMNANSPMRLIVTAEGFVQQEVRFHAQARANATESIIRLQRQETRTPALPPQEGTLTPPTNSPFSQAFGP